ncbi:uncharacterized protein CEXT_18831 [Caerostris extrusa]|uniref:Uncharacterized protein n=1 Tax=Caerostris extrusa TaxID=172846 RepID=A0AAV4WD58_CAEEX|nr:uncharacterized protein CEXT_18831 [Caerostris extrusa]
MCFGLLVEFYMYVWYCAMHRFELKQVAELLWKNATTKEEKTPIISNSTRVPDSGSITKEANMNGSVDSKLGYDRKLLDAGGDSCDDNSDSPPKMTLLRKLCFVLSLNGGIVYVAALLWWIPCKHPLCLFLTNWTMNMSYPLTTNMEIKSTDLSYSYFLGYADDDGGRLASLQMKTGAMMWNVSTEVILHNIFCNLNIPSDGNNEVPDCIGTSYNYIMAFNSTKGE